MPRIQPVNPDTAEPAVKATLDAVRKKFGGKLPNLISTFARSPVALGGYVALSESLSKGRLSAKQREIVALATAQVNRCEYCLSAHSLAGKHAGLTPDDLQAARRGNAQEPTDAAVAALARKVTEARGHVADADLAAARAAGLDDGLIIEVVANVVANVFTNFTNNVAKTEVDFPIVDVALAA